MNIKNLFAILLILTLLTCTLVIPTSAKGNENNNDIEIIINGEVSVETKAKIERYFATGEPIKGYESGTYGLTCTLLGHKLESSVVDVITHKVSSTSPRCLKK